MNNMHLMTPTNPKPPLPLRDALDIEDLFRTDPCEADIVLGSFWLGSRRSFESRLVKAFKACAPARDYEPHISHLCRFYAKLTIERLAVVEAKQSQMELSDAMEPLASASPLRSTDVNKTDWVVRVLGSGEKNVDPARPQSLLVDVLCSMMGARDGSDIFFKSQARPPMRIVDRLAGADALKGRLRYVAQDLFIRPGKLSGSVLLLDDICNTGASTRVYASALKEFAGADRVVTVNLAATRFSRGKDGRGMLQLDVSRLAQYPSLGQVWTDGASVMHLREDCPSAVKPIACDVRFMAERSAKPCPHCTPSPVEARKWWRVW